MCSIGFRSGLWAGRNHSLAPAARMAALIAGALWLPRLSRSEEDQKTVRGTVFPTNDVAGAQGGDQHPLDMGAEDLRVDGAIEDPGCTGPVVAQGGEERHGIPVPERGFGLHPVAALAPAAQRGHVGPGRGFIYEHQTLTFCFSACLAAKPVSTFVGHAPEHDDV